MTTMICKSPLQELSRALPLQIIAWWVFSEIPKKILKYFEFEVKTTKVRIKSKETTSKNLTSFIG